MQCNQKETITLKVKDMKAEVGRYYFGRHYSIWGIWQWNVVDETFTSANHIKDVQTYLNQLKIRTNKAIQTKININNERG